ncbi:MAG: prolipoprotein diacylglyceryl transferase [Anaerolineae bacterium]
MINPILVRIGPIAIHWYGVLIVGGALLSAYAASREASHRGQDPEAVWDMLIWVLFLGIVGARLYHVFSTPAGGQLGWPYYKQHPLEAFKIWQGGLAIYGALAGGVLGVATYAWRHHLNLVLWLDIIFPTVLIGQAVGRWGNFINQEVYGYPTNLPWGLYIPPERRLPGLEQYDHFHPVFLYESIGCIIGFFIISWLGRRFDNKLLPGDRVALYFLWYPTLRIFTESLRPDAWTVGGWPMAQVLSLIMVLAAALFILLRHTVLKPSEKPAS